MIAFYEYRRYTAMPGKLGVTHNELWTLAPFSAPVTESLPR